MKWIFAILSIVLPMFSFCEVLPYITHNEKFETKFTSVEIFQTFSKGFTLVSNKDGGVVKLILYEDIYYGGKELVGKFAIINTYSYENKEENIKTIPIFIKYPKYKEYKE